MTIVEFCNITKKFGNVIANDNISLSIRENTIHCIVGENGAGKSTLMKILFGIYKQDEGNIIVKGNITNFKSSLDAIRLKIGMLHQHFMLIDNFTVLENIILGAEISKGYKLDFNRAEEKINEIIDKYNFMINPNDYIYQLSISARQKVELLKLLYRNSEILILDEPTAVLTPIELKEFYSILSNFKKEGKTIILITHKLNEVKEISERVSVLRKGKLVYETDRENLDVTELSRKIIGDIDIFSSLPKVEDNNYLKENVLTLKDINLIDNGINILRNINFSLRRNNIFGICGVEGNGQNEIVEILIGINKKFAGKIIPELKEVSIVPDDRTKKGMIGEMSISENYFLREKKKKVANDKLLSHIEESIVKRFDIKLPYSGCQMKYLSGGNQQKAIVGREIMLNYKILIFSHPTRGVDIRARDNIHREILSERNRGNAILLISSDLDELLTLSDELAIIYKGTFLKVFLKSEFEKQFRTNKTVFLEKIGKLMMGILN